MDGCKPSEDYAGQSPRSYDVYGKPDRAETARLGGFSGLSRAALAEQARAGKATKEAQAEADRAAHRAESAQACVTLVDIKAAALLAFLAFLAPQREYSIAKTKIEEAVMRAVRGLTACALVAAVVLAPGYARAQDAGDAVCITIAEAGQKIVDAGGGAKLVPLNHSQLLFARGLYVASPPVSPYPPGEKAFYAPFDDGSVAVVFSDGAKSCGRFAVSPAVTKLLLNIDKSL